MEYYSSENIVFHFCTVNKSRWQIVGPRPRISCLDTILLLRNQFSPMSATLTISATLRVRSNLSFTFVSSYRREFEKRRPYQTARRRGHGHHFERWCILQAVQPTPTQKVKPLRKLGPTQPPTFDSHWPSRPHP